MIKSVNIALTAITHQDGPYRVVLVRRNQPGYQLMTYPPFKTLEGARVFANMENERLGHTPLEAWRIVGSSLTFP